MLSLISCQLKLQAEAVLCKISILHMYVPTPWPGCVYSIISLNKERCMTVMIYTAASSLYVEALLRYIRSFVTETSTNTI